MTANSALWNDCGVFAARFPPALSSAGQRPMSDSPRKPFFDTNILIYAVSQNDSRAEIAEELLSRGGIISVKVLNEFVATASRKLNMSWGKIAEALGAFRALSK